MRRVRLSPHLLEKLAAPIRGQGGFQDFLRALRARLADGSLQVDDALQERLEHYAFDFGRGGWQTFFRELLDEVERAAAA